MKKVFKYFWEIFQRSDQQNKYSNIFNSEYMQVSTIPTPGRRYWVSDVLLHHQWLVATMWNNAIDIACKIKLIVWSSFDCLWKENSSYSLVSLPQNKVWRMSLCERHQKLQWDGKELLIPMGGMTRPQGSQKTDQTMTIYIFKYKQVYTFKYKVNLD